MACVRPQSPDAVGTLAARSVTLRVQALAVAKPVGKVIVDRRLINAKPRDAVDLVQK
jgi:hypothetical protein